MDRQDFEEIYETMKKTWRSPIVAREQIGDFTGGVLNSKTMANLDCQGKGVPERFKIGRKTVYPIDGLISWLIGRTEDAPRKNRIVPEEA